MSKEDKNVNKDKINVDVQGSQTDPIPFVDKDASGNNKGGPSSVFGFDKTVEQNKTEITGQETQTDPIPSVDEDASKNNQGGPLSVFGFAKNVEQNKPEISGQGTQPVTENPVDDGTSKKLEMCEADRKKLHKYLENLNGYFKDLIEVNGVKKDDIKKLLKEKTNVEKNALTETAKKVISEAFSNLSNPILSETTQPKKPDVDTTTEGKISLHKKINNNNSI
tara:strand:+ start:31 stop:696 length:666 start_codon:yes stop_codon:yes gene_type:complete